VAYRAVLFDLDGTLLNSLDDLADSMNETLAAFGLPRHPVDSYRFYVGDGIENLVLRAAPQAKDNPDLVLKILLGMRDRYDKNWAAKTRPYDGIAELLDHLTRRNIPMAVFSNKPHNFTERCVTKLLSDWRFGLVYGVNEHNPRKPDPTVPRRIADKYHIELGHFLYLGDTRTDMQTALASGMNPVGALWGFRPREELEASGAKWLIEHPLQLMDVIDE
jgi:phosphoglycolate phosphatase